MTDEDFGDVPDPCADGHQFMPQHSGELICERCGEVGGYIVWHTRDLADAHLRMQALAIATQYVMPDPRDVPGGKDHGDAFTEARRKAIRQQAAWFYREATGQEW